LQAEHWFFAKRILLRLGLAALFGSAYYLFLEWIQPLAIETIYNCDSCARCANLLFDREQPILAVCAGLALFILGFLTIRGFRGGLKTLAVSFLVFQVYSLLTIWSVLRSEECTALYRVRAPFVIAVVLLGIEILMLSGLWAGLCALPILSFQALRSTVFADDEDQPLDLGLR
jgi:hypothetical protein